MRKAAAAEDNADPSSASEYAEEEDVMDVMRVMIKFQKVLEGRADKNPQQRLGLLPF